MTKRTKILMMLLALISSSCTTVRLPDDPIFTIKGKFGARVSYMREESKAKNHDISLDEWRAIEYGKACVSTDTIIGLVGAIKKMCSENATTCYWFRKEVKLATDVLNEVAPEEQ